MYAHTMDLPPGRAPFTLVDDYKEMRPPKVISNAPTSSMLSADAKEFVPNQSNQIGHSNLQDRLLQNQSGGTYNRNNVHYQPHQRYSNGVQHANHYHNLQHQQHHQRHHNYKNYHQHQHHHHHQQQQQQHQHQPQSFASQLAGCTYSVQNRLKISNNKNPSNQQYYNQQHQNYQQPSTSFHNQASTSNRNAADVESIALDYLQSCIICLNENPGQFDTIATRFLTIYEGMENNYNVIANAMEIIFEESIKKPNFRYMGAKLYNLLHMLNLKEDSLFHVLLKAKLDFHQDEMKNFMESNQQNVVRETALFLAELYMQLRGDDSRIQLIAVNIVLTLKLLLTKETADNVRCICLTLKLAGFDLTKDCPTEMQEIISMLDDINVKSPGKYPLAVNVISLQKNNWGRKCSSSNSFSETEKLPEPLRISDEPIFYGPDGRELTAEEADFLQGGAVGGGSTDDEDAGDLDIDFGPEMDEEAEDAFREFRKQAS